MTAPSIKEALEQIVAIDQIQRQICVDADPAGNTYALEEVDGPCAKIARAALATLPPAGERREAIARIIDPRAFADFGEVYAFNTRERRYFALDKADELLASGLVQDEAGWRDISTAPKEGRFLVYLPDEDIRPFQVMYRNKEGITVIGGAFGFDMSKPTHWMPLPAPPIRSARNGGEG